MKRFVSILLLCAFALSVPPAVLIGCKASPQLIAYRSADALVSSVDLAMQGWADHVVSERKRIAALPSPDRVSPQSELLKREGKVMDALGKYHAAIGVADVAMKSARATNGPPPEIVAQAASALLAVIKEVK